MSAPRDHFCREIKAGDYFCMAFRAGNSSEIKVGVVVEVTKLGKIKAWTGRMARWDDGKFEVSSRVSTLVNFENLIVVDQDQIPTEAALKLQEKE